MLGECRVSAGGFGTGMGQMQGGYVLGMGGISGVGLLRRVFGADAGLLGGYGEDAGPRAGLVQSGCVRV